MVAPLIAAGVGADAVISAVKDRPTKSSTSYEIEKRALATIGEQNFLRELAKQAPLDDRWNRDDKDWQAKLKTAPGAAFKSMFTTAGKIATLPLYLTYKAGGAIRDKWDPKGRYGRDLGPNEAAASNAAIGLLAGQYLSLITHPKPPSWYAFPSTKQDFKEREELRRDLIASASQFSGDAAVNPISQYRSTLKALRETPPSDELGEKAGQAVADNYKAHYAEAGQQLDDKLQKVEAIYQAEIDSLQQQIMTGNLADPRVVALRLHQLRYGAQKAIGELQKAQVAELGQASDELFEAAKKLADPATAGEVTDETLKSNAQTLLDSLRAEGKLSPTDSSADTVVEGASDDTVVKGAASIESEAKKKPAELIKEDIAKLDELKANEKKRIQDESNNRTKALNDSMMHVAEDYYAKMTKSVNAAAAINRLNKKQSAEFRKYRREHQPESQAEGSLLNAAEHQKDLVKELDSVKLLNGFFDEQGYLEGAAWTILKNNDGSTSVYTTGRSPHAKQQAIMDQTALLALKHDVINFKANATYVDKKTKQVKVDKKAVGEMAIRQAIALMSTTGVNPEKSKVRALVKTDNAGNKTYSDPMSPEQVFQVYDQYLTKAQRKQIARLQDGQTKAAYEGKVEQALKNPASDAQAMYDALKESKSTSAEEFKRTKADSAQKVKEILKQKGVDVDDVKEAKDIIAPPAAAGSM